MFNLGPAELVVLILLGVIWLGPDGLPERVQSWTWSDWVLVGIIFLLGCAMLAGAHYAHA